LLAHLVGHLFKSVAAPPVLQQEIELGFLRQKLKHRVVAFARREMTYMSKVVIRKLQVNLTLVHHLDLVHIPFEASRTEHLRKLVIAPNRSRAFAAKMVRHFNVIFLYRDKQS
jgi:hypothetical protein